ncbi:MAG: thiamine phosphate synthase [Acidobacteriota bacterium]
MRKIKANFFLYLVTDNTIIGERDFFEVIKEAVEAGVTIVQLREINISDREFIAKANKLKEILSAKNIPLIINNRCDIASAVNAEGVHLGQNDLPIEYARKILGKRKIIGVSANNVEEAIEAQNKGADYIAAGPIFFTPTKVDIRTPIGLDGLEKMRRYVKAPLIAIGGINRENVREVIKRGVDGVAVVSAIMASSEPYKATKELLKIIEETKNLREFR